MDLKEKIRAIENFPKEGILFRDITTLLKDGEALSFAIEKFMEHLEDVDFDLVIGPESRGFIFGVPIAVAKRKGFVPVRKKGKLPATTTSKEYSLEYGTEVIEIHEDAIKKGDKVIVIDDLIATGGTTKAVCQLLEEMGAEIVKIVTLIELLDLNGREVIGNYNISSIIEY